MKKKLIKLFSNETFSNVCLDIGMFGVIPVIVAGMLGLTFLQLTLLGIQVLGLVCFILAFRVRWGTWW